MIDKAFDVIFFDLDGTLIDTFAAERKAIAQLLSEQGIDPHPDRVERFHDVNLGYWEAYGREEISREKLLTERFETFFHAIGYPLRGEPDEAPRMDQAYRMFLAENTIVFDGAVRLVRYLSERVRLLLATNSLLENVLRKLDIAGLRDFFPQIATLETIGHQKPERAFFERSLELCGYPDPDRVLMIGDLWDADIVGAARAGIRTCWMNPNRQPIPENGDGLPHLHVHSLMELQNLLSGQDSPIPS